jgi:DNA polymerase III subunit delta'
MSFKNIAGQDPAVKALDNMISKGQVRGAYLFSGPDGVGKHTVAVSFAKAVNCENPGDGPCGCNSCCKIDSMNHPDVFMIFPEGASGSIKIDRIRDVKYEAGLKPYEGKKRIFIIDAAERMTEEAQNAFLKVLEEPPVNHILILITSGREGLLPTVVSRCKVLKFSLLPRNRISEFLKERAFDPREAELYSHMAMGSIGKALAFKEKDTASRRDAVLENFFFKKSVLFREAVLSEEAGRPDTEESLYTLLCWYRDILVAKFTGDNERLLNIDRAGEILSCAERFSKEKLEKDMLVIMKTIDCVRKNVNPKIALFNMAVELKGN